MILLLHSHCSSTCKHLYTVECVHDCIDKEFTIVKDSCFISVLYTPDCVRCSCVAAETVKAAGVRGCRRAACFVCAHSAAVTSTCCLHLLQCDVDSWKNRI